MDELAELLTEIKETQDLLDEECGGFEKVVEETGLSDSIISRINQVGVSSDDIRALVDIHTTLQSNPVFDASYYSYTPTNQNLDRITSIVRATVQVEMGDAAKGTGYAALLGIGLIVLYKAYGKIREVLRRMRGKVAAGTAGAEKVVSRYICNTGDVKDASFKVSPPLKKAIDSDAVTVLSEYYNKVADVISKLGTGDKVEVPKLPAMETIVANTAFTGTDTVTWAKLKEVLDKKIEKGATTLLAELEEAGKKLKDDDEAGTSKKEDAKTVIAAIRAELNKATGIEAPLLASVAKASDLLVKRTKLGDTIVGELQSALLKVANAAKDEGLIAEIGTEWGIFKKLPDASRSIASFSSKFASIHDKLKANHSAVYTEYVKGDKLTVDNVKAILGGSKTWYVVSQ